MTRVDRQGYVILAIWLALSVALIATGWTNISARAGWDPDDQLRLVQLRDFLNGQGWFDNRQYRMNIPEGAPMHWSRLVELPLAAIILLLRPLFGQAAAEMIAVTLIPLALFGAIMVLLAQIASHLTQAKGGVFAAMIVATSVPLLMQLRPMRIDHHGWQIAMAVLSLASLFHVDARKAGTLLGAALAIWLHISLEGAPMSAAFFVYLGWRWLMSPDESRRLFFAITAFAAMSLALYFGSQAQGLNATIFCDTLSPPHVIAIIAATAVMLPAVALAPGSRNVRAAVLVVAGATAAFVLWRGAPACASGAFGNMDPLVREYWYANVKEGLPVWRQDMRTALFLLAGPVVGLASCVVLARKSTGPEYARLLTIAFFVGYASLLSVFVFRTISVASAYAIVPAAALAAHIFGKYRQAETPFLRVGSVALILFVMVPGGILNALPDFGQPTPSSKDMQAEEHAAACESASSVAQLSTLPRGQFLVPFDMGPMILAQTRHSVLASSHHRNEKAMHDHIEIFRSQPDVAMRLMRARGIDYLALCPDEEELDLYVRKNPGGLWAQIAKRNVPDWLEPLAVKGKGIMVWRVR